MFVGLCSLCIGVPVLQVKLDENQPREQAGFRSKYSTTDHIHGINQLKEKCREYNIQLQHTTVCRIRGSREDI